MPKTFQVDPLPYVLQTSGLHTKNDIKWVRTLQREMETTYFDFSETKT